ncbi:hypothetical protein GCM10008941_31850 [Rhizomicrobium palustre]
MLRPNAQLTAQANGASGTRDLDHQPFHTGYPAKTSQDRKIFYLRVQRGHSGIFRFVNAAIVPGRN